MSLPKVIITADGFLRLGMVNMHEDLIVPFAYRGLQIVYDYDDGEELNLLYKVKIEYYD